jgi:hypothetical protein
MKHMDMKRMFASLGLAAVGTASLHAAYAPDSTDTSKMWNLSGTLRGFYDDNYNTLPHKQGSVGFQVNPSFSLNLPMQQTEIGLRYSYGLYYYQNRERLGQNPIDQTHQFDLWLDHAFTPRWEARIQDTVTVAQEPSLLTPGTVSTAQRIEGNNVANTARLSVNTDWTREFSTVLAYQNTLYDYQNSGATVTGAPGAESVGTSYAGLLNRVEQNISLDLQWHVSATTTALIGYQLGLVNFTGNEPVAAFNYPVGAPVNTTLYYSKSRDNLSHYGYVGVQHSFLANLTGQAKVGVEYTEYYNDPSAKSSLGPYADASLVYTYASGSYAQIGVTESRNATSTVNVDSQGHITQDQQSTTIYGSINHKLTPKLTGSVVGHYQYSTYNDGQFNNQSAQFYNLGLNLSYAFTHNFSSEVGYNFDYYTTPVSGQSYTRNRVYLGVTASY